MRLSKEATTTNRACPAGSMSRPRARPQPEIGARQNHAGDAGTTCRHTDVHTGLMKGTETPTLANETHWDICAPSRRGWSGTAGRDPRPAHAGEDTR